MIDALKDAVVDYFHVGLFEDLRDGDDHGEVLWRPLVVVLHAEHRRLALAHQHHLSCVVVEAGVSDVRIKHKDAGVPDTLVNLEQQTAQGGGAESLRAGDIVFVSKPLVIYVDGEVNKPGAVSFTEGLTVTQALTRSGGHKRTAKLSSAYILRGSEKLEINLKHILAGKAADVSLRPNDQLILTESLF